MISGISSNPGEISPGLLRVPGKQCTLFREERGDGVMRLEQISYFLQVAETQSMTGAAKELYISQPALSKQIALLEREVGVPLFERKARGVVLTSAGRQF